MNGLGGFLASFVEVSADGGKGRSPARDGMVGVAIGDVTGQPHVLAEEVQVGRHVIVLQPRLELRGVDVGDRWTPVIEQARARAGEHLFAFHDLHYLFALARAGAEGEAERFLQSMRSRADGLSGDAAYVWGAVAAPAAEAIAAFVAGRRDDAGEKLAPAADAGLVGGEIELDQVALSGRGGGVRRRSRRRGQSRRERRQREKRRHGDPVAGKGHRQSASR